MSDAEARRLRDVLKVLTEGRTAFTAGKNPEQARDADLILVLEDGRLVEQGTHEELLARKGVYYRLLASVAAKKE